MNINFNKEIYDALQLDPSNPREIRAIHVDVFYSDEKRPSGRGIITGLKLLGF